MDETTRRAVIAAAVTAALESIDASEVNASAGADATAPEPHSFGHFRIPPDARVTGFNKLGAADAE